MFAWRRVYKNARPTCTRYTNNRIQLRLRNCNYVRLSARRWYPSHTTKSSASGNIQFRSRLFSTMHGYDYEDIIEVDISEYTAAQKEREAKAAKTSKSPEEKEKTGRKHTEEQATKTSKATEEKETKTSKTPSRSARKPAEHKAATSEPEKSTTSEDQQKKIPEIPLTDETNELEMTEDVSDEQKIAQFTPAMRQYLELKAKYPDFLILYQIGDFYEMFLDDAVRGSELLDIALTSRGKGKDGNEIPMAGIPVHALDSYVERLLKKGVMVAICDQTESAAEAKKRRGLVKREVTRLITPGTLTEDKFLNARKSNYLVCLVKEQDEEHIAIAWSDLSTGEFHLSRTTMEELISDLERLQPSEVLIPYSLLQDKQLEMMLKPYCVTPQGKHAFDVHHGMQKLQQLFEKEVANRIQHEFSNHELKAASGLLHYVHMTQRGLMPKFSVPKRFASESVMFLGAATRRALELSSTQFGEYKGSLLSVIDTTVTAGGGRLLYSRIHTPLLSVAEIDKRLDVVEFFFKSPQLRDSVRNMLHSCFDIERSLQRLSLGRGSPRDLMAIAQTLEQAINIRNAISEYIQLHRPPLGDSVTPYLSIITDSSFLIGELKRAIVPEPPTDISHGNFIAPGYNEKLDQLRKLRDNSKQLIEELQDKYRESTGVPSLKIKHKTTWGYFIEINSRDHKKLDDNIFKHFQTKVNSMCYKTEEIRDLEQEINLASVSAQALEEKLFRELVAQVLNHSTAIKDCAYALAAIDVSCANALFAAQHNCCRPVVTTTGEFNVKKGRHLVVEALQPHSTFVSNDCVLTPEQRVWLITGANMGGKSTFLRQNAIICILAQMGLFVPAQSATIGIVDAVFTRVGAYDDLSRNRSTFMVEMQETAAILRKATNRSLVIMDEIGRGTSTQDGLSIAWAVLEHLCNKIGCRTLFATHYHELVDIANLFSRVGKYYTAVEYRDGKTVFLHKIVPGQAQKSYGIEVAKLAGMPAEVIDRAMSIFKALEENGGIPRL